MKKCIIITTLSDDLNSIKKLHNYELPEISYYEIKGSKEILEWISEYTK